MHVLLNVLEAKRMFELVPVPMPWGLTAGLPGFARGGAVLHQNSLCQKFKLVPGTQPPLIGDGVVNNYRHLRCTLKLYNLKVSYYYSILN